MTRVDSLYKNSRHPWSGVTQRDSRGWKLRPRRKKGARNANGGWLSFPFLALLKRIDRVDRRLLEREGTRASVSASRPPECAFHGSRTTSTKSRVYLCWPGGAGRRFIFKRPPRPTCKFPRVKTPGSPVDRLNIHATPSASSNAVVCLLERVREIERFAPFCFETRHTRNIFPTSNPILQDLSSLDPVPHRSTRNFFVKTTTHL